MNSQVMGRYLRARGFRLKQPLRIATLIAICIWLLYQISRPHDKSSASKFSDQHSILWRKVNIGLSASRNELDPERPKTINKSKNWESDDQLAISHIEKADEDLKEKSFLVDDKNDRENSQMERKDLHGDNSDNNKRRAKDYLNEEGYHDIMQGFMLSSRGNLHGEAEIDGKKTLQGKEVTKVLNKRGEHNLALELEDKVASPPDRMDNHAENGLRESGFDDENGVPFGLNDISESNIIE